MSSHMRQQIRISGKANYTPSHSEQRLAVVELAGMRQAAALAAARARRVVTVSNRPRRGR